MCSTIRLHRKNVAHVILGAGPADGVVVLGGGRLGEMPPACCVTEVTPPTTPDDSQSSGNSHHSNNNINNNNSSNNLSNNTGSSSTDIMGRSQHVVNPSVGAEVATAGGGVPVIPSDRRVVIATNVNDKNSDKAGEQRVRGAPTSHGTAGNTAGGVDEESTMSADSSDSARQSSAVEREREKVRSFLSKKYNIQNVDSV